MAVLYLLIVVTLVFGGAYLHYRLKNDKATGATTAEAVEAIKAVVDAVEDSAAVVAEATLATDTRSSAVEKDITKETGDASRVLTQMGRLQDGQIVHIGMFKLLTSSMAEADITMMSKTVTDNTYGLSGSTSFKVKPVQPNEPLFYINFLHYSGDVDAKPEDLEGTEDLGCASGYTIIIPIEECDAECQLSVINLVKEAITKSSYARKIVKVDKTVTIGRLSGRGGLRVLTMNVPDRSMTDKELSVFYGPFEARLGAVDKKIAAHTIMQALLSIYNKGSVANVAIFGGTGTGKSTLIRALTGALSSSSVLWADEAALLEMAADPQLTVDILKANCKPHIVIVIDEAHKLSAAAKTALLELMDGSAGEMLVGVKISYIVGINSTFKDFVSESSDNEALVRPGRVHVVLNTQKLSNELATRAIELLKGDKSKVLLDPAFKPKEPMTLGEVCNLFGDAALVENGKKNEATV